MCAPAAKTFHSPQNSEAISPQSDVTLVNGRPCALSNHQPSHPVGHSAWIPSEYERRRRWQASRIRMPRLAASLITWCRNLR